MVGLGTFLQLLQGGCVNLGVADVDHKAQAFPEMVGALDYYIQCLKASRGDVAVCCHLCLATIEVQTNKYPEFVIHNALPSVGGHGIKAGAGPRRCGPWVAATLRP